MHTTPSLYARHRSPYRSISKAELDRIDAARGRILSRYTKEEMDDLRAKYTPEQFASIAAAEQAVDLKDLATAGPRRDVLRPRRTDPTGYSRIQPTIDKKIERLRGEWDNTFDKRPGPVFHALPDADKKMQRVFEILVDPMYNPHDAVDARRKVVKWAESVRKNPPAPSFEPDAEALAFSRDFSGESDGDAELHKLLDDGVSESDRARILKNKPAPMSKNEGESDDAFAARQLAWSRRFDQLMSKLGREAAGKRIGQTPTMSTRERLEKALKWRDASSPEVAPEIPMIRDPKVRWESAAENEAAEESGGADDETIEALARLAKATGKSVETLRGYSSRILVQHGVVNQTRLGKIRSEYALAVAGDGKGNVGLGEGKAAEVPTAFRTAMLNAIRNMRPVRRYEDRTIYGELRAKVGATEVALGARPPGFGLRVSGRIFEIARAAGIYDLAAKVTRSRNPMNTAKAVWQALCEQKDPEDIARARGKKLVDVRKVYYAGLN